MPQPFEFLPTVNTGKMEAVGVQALVAGAQQFFSDMGKVEQWMGRVGSASTRMASVSSSAFRVVGNAVGSSAAILLAATTAIEGLGGAAIAMSSVFQQKMTIAATALGTTEVAMRDLSDAAIEMSRVAPISIGQLADATVELSKAGISMQQMSEGALQAATNLMIASGGELTIRDASLLVAGGMNAFNIAGRESARVADALTAAANSSAITFRDLRLSFQQVSAPAAAIGYSIEETTTALGLLGRAGLRGSDAGTSLKQMFISLLAPSAKAKDAIAQYGIALYDTNGHALSMRAVVQELEKAFGDEAIAAGRVTEQERAHALALIFGSDAWRAATILAREGADAYDKMASAAKNLTAQEMATKMLGAVNAQFLILKNNAEAAAVIIGREALPVIGALLERFNKLAQSIKPEVFETLGKTLVASITGGDISDIMDQARAQFGPLANVFEAWLKLLIEVRTAITERLVPAFYTLFSAIGQGKSVGDILTATFNSVSKAVRDVSTGVAGGLTLLSNIIKDLRRSAVGLEIINTVFRGLAALPFVALAAMVIKISTSFLGLGGSTFAVALALGAIAGVLPKSTTEWENLGRTLSAYVQPALIAVGATLTYLAYVQVATFTAAVTQAGTRVLLFAANVAAAAISITAFSLLNIIGNIGQVGLAVMTAVPFIVKMGATLAVLAVQALATATALTALFIVRTVATAFTIGSELVSGFFLVLRGGMGAISLTTWTLGVLSAAVRSLQLGTLVSGLASLASGAVAAGGALLTGLGGAIVAAATAIAPFIIGILAITAAVGALYLAWTNNFGGIRDIAAIVLNWVTNKLIEFFNFLKGLPIIGEVIKWTEGAVKTAQEELPKLVTVARNVVADVEDEFARGFPRVQNLLRGMMQVPEVTLPKALQTTSRANSWDQYNLGVRQAKQGVDDWAAAMDAAQSESERSTKAAQRHIKALREEVSKLEEDLRSARNEFEKWSDPKLIGMGAADDAIFALEQEYKKAQLEVLKTGDAVDETNKKTTETFDLLAAQRREATEGIPVALQLWQWSQKQAQDAASRAHEAGSAKHGPTAQEIMADELKKQLDIAKLQRDIEFEPQLRAAKKLHDQLAGLDKEVTLQQALDNIRAASDKIAQLEPALAGKKEEVDAAQEALDAQNESANTFKGTRDTTLEIENQILDRFQRTTAQLNAQKDAVIFLNEALNPGGQKQAYGSTPWSTVPTSRYNETKAAVVELQGSFLAAGEDTIPLEEAVAAVNQSYKDIGKSSVNYERSVITNWRNTERWRNEVDATGREYDRQPTVIDTIGAKVKDIAKSSLLTKNTWDDVNVTMSDTLLKNVDTAKVHVIELETQTKLVNDAVKDQSTMWDHILEVLKNIQKTMKEGVILENLTKEGILPSKTGPGIQPGQVPGFQHGTMFAPGGLSLVGETGPEIIHLPRGSQVYPTRATNFNSQSTSYHDEWNISGVSNPVDVWGVIQKRLRMKRITGGR